MFSFTKTSVLLLFINFEMRLILQNMHLPPKKHVVLKYNVKGPSVAGFCRVCKPLL